MLAKLQEEYEEKYGPLRKEANTANKWQWVKNPWPWDNEEDL
jgi:spore coat protein JB